MVGEVRAAHTAVAGVRGMGEGLGRIVIIDALAVPGAVVGVVLVAEGAGGDGVGEVLGTGGARGVGMIVVLLRLWVRCLAVMVGRFDSDEV